jgi:hypothetical protein
MGSLVKIFPSQSQSAEFPHPFHSYPYMRVTGEEKEEIEERRIQTNL